MEEDLADADDFVLNIRGSRFLNADHLIIPNVRGQTYTFGDKYPGAREGEEFVFCRARNPDPESKDKADVVEPIHFMITVNEDDGRYWIKNATSTAKTFVNEEIVKEPRRLQLGDIISVGSPKTWSTEQGLVYRVEDHAVYFKWVQPKEKDGFIHVEAESSELPPLENELILGNILKLLPFPELLKSRLVCKKWEQEASKIVEKKGQACHDFSWDYASPSQSSLCFVYLQEMKKMKMRNVEINVEHILGIPTPEEPGEKMVDDIQKLFKPAHNFSSLVLNGKITNNEEFIPVSHILLGLGNKLLELNFKIEIIFLPEVFPQFPKMSNLKKLVHKCSTSLTPGPKSNVCKRWVAHLVPLFQETLEDFSCSRNIAPFYLEEFLLHSMHRLREITICDDEDDEDYQPDVKWILSTLLRLQNPLAILNLSVYIEDTESASMLEQVVLKNSKSLQHLLIDIKIHESQEEATTITEIKFPCFPKLKVLELNYSPTTRITWKGSVDYKKHFPALEKLKIRFLYEDSSFNWGSEDHVFNSFFPEGSKISCETLKALKIPVLTDPRDADLRLKRNEWDPFDETYANFQNRLEQIKGMFPKVKKVEMECLSTEQSYPDLC